MRKIVSLILSFVFALSVCLLIVGCGNDETDKPKDNVTTPEYPKAFTCEDDPHVQKEGSDLYYVDEDGNHVTGVYAFYNNNVYYFNKGDETGVKFTLKYVTPHIISCEILHSCMFIVKGDDSALVIDLSFGVGNVRDLVEMLVGDMPYEVALTHTDPDHVGGSCSFEGVTKVWTTAECSEDREMGWSVERRAGDIINASNPFIIDDICPNSETFEFDIFDTGKIFDLGNYEIEVLKVPGHSRGLAMFLFKQDRILLTGDGGNKKTVVSEGLKTYYDTFKKVNERNSEWDYLLTSHDSGDLLIKEGADYILQSCEKIFELYSENQAEDWGATSVSGWGIQYRMEKIWL